MRKSRDVPLTILAALALSSAACNDTPVTKNCVDAQGHIIPDTTCQTHYGGAHYVYGGRSGGHLGDTVFGGSDTEAGVSRGGLGSEGDGHGGGEGGHGGGGGE
jgi:hypothetical protein